MKRAKFAYNSEKNSSYYDFMKLAGLGAAALGFPMLGKAAVVKPADRPNVLSIAIDDLRDQQAINHAEVMAAIDGKTLAGKYQPGVRADLTSLETRLVRLERIVAAVTALFLGVATVVAGAWGLIFWGPVAHK